MSRGHFIREALERRLVMGTKHEWMTDGMSFDASEKVLADYEAEGWEIVSLNWDDGSFFGCWKRPVTVIPSQPESQNEAREALEEIAESLQIDHLGVDSCDLGEMIVREMHGDDSK